MHLLEMANLAALALVGYLPQMDVEKEPPMIQGVDVVYSWLSCVADVW